MDKITMSCFFVTFANKRQPLLKQKTYNNMIQMKDGFAGERSIVLPDMVRTACKEDDFLNQLYITDIGYYPHARYHYRERPEGVKQYILIYCMKGSGYYRVDSRSYDVSEGQYFILPPDTPHLYASDNDNPWTIYWVHFSGRQAPVFAGDTLAPQAISSGMTSRISDRNNIFEEIFLTLSDSYCLDNLRYAASLFYGFLATFRFLGHFRKYNSEEARTDTDNVVAAAVRYMNENLERTLTLSDIADYAGYSVSHFATMFKNSTGHSVLNYFNMLKVQRSCQLLETTDMKINQICAKVGIDDNYYFSRLFKKITGISPKVYRIRVAEREK